MSTLVTRAGKGSPLTHNEVDANFTNLNTDKVEKTSAAITGGTIDGTVIGGTTPAAGTFTTLTAQTEVLKGTGQNLLTRSQLIGGTDWQSVSGATASTNSVVAPDSTTTASTLTVASGGYYRQITGVATISAGATYTFSCYVKASASGGASNVRLTTNNVSAWNTGFSTRFALTSSWQRVSVSGTITGATSCYAIIGAIDATGSNDALCAGNVDVWGAQLEISSSAGTYIPTTTAPVYGTPTLSFSGVAGLGLQSDGSLYATSAGTGNVRFYTNNIGQEQARVSHTASAVNYVQVTGAATGGNVPIFFTGSDANVLGAIYTKGTGSFSFYSGSGTSRQVRIDGANLSTANYLDFYGASAGSAPSVRVGGSDTNIDLNLTTKGTGNVVLANIGSGVNTRAGNSTGFNTYANLIFDWSGAGNGYKHFVTSNHDAATSSLNNSIRFWLNNTGSSTGSSAPSVNNVRTIDTNPAYTRIGTAGGDQFSVANTASAVNYVQVTGSATGGRAIISTQGSDASPALDFILKGTPTGPGYRFQNQAGAGTCFGIVSSAASIVNYLQVVPSTTGFGAVIRAAGSDTNIPLVVQPQGTGALQAQQTDSTATGGNARGANAIDLQTFTRTSAAQVASGLASSVLGGARNTSGAVASTVVCGTDNTANANNVFVGSGATNFSNGTSSAIVSGLSNTSNGTFAFIGAGQANTTAGFFNVVVGGQTNSATSASAVTTQSATMNGTTAVTLSGSNANIKVGQLIIGTNIASASGATPYTYVAAISGTSLTLSQAASGSSTSTLSFFTPHGVVVGGGNNQATGSYSFIGGGGDAGTAANRNVASGDWSFVGGGSKNTASGSGSFIGGGGINNATGSFGNTASGESVAIVGGILNSASAKGSFIGGGFQNSINSQYATIAGGVQGNSRGIEGSFVFPACVLPIASGSGISQSALLVLGKQTTDATPTVLVSNSSAASTTNQVILPNNSAYAFRGTVIANVTGGGNTKAWAIEGAIKRGANAASTALVGTPTVTSAYADVGAATWAIAVTADTTNGGLAVTFTGQAATTIRCVAKLETTEVTF